MKILRIILFNSVEYMNIMDMQSNSVQTQLEHSVMKKKLYDIITALHKQHKDRCSSRYVIYTKRCYDTFTI